MQLAEDIW